MTRKQCSATQNKIYFARPTVVRLNIFLLSSKLFFFSTEKFTLNKGGGNIINSIDIFGSHRFYSNFFTSESQNIARTYQLQWVWRVQLSIHLHLNHSSSMFYLFSHKTKSFLKFWLKNNNIFFFTVNIFISKIF